MFSQTMLRRVCVAAIILTAAGCKQNPSTPIEPVQTSHLMYQPKGTITGVVRNRVTSVPVPGAAISLGFDGSVKSTTSDGAGAFSFANVPVGKYQIVNGTSVSSGTYTLTVSLVNYNAGQSDPNKKYRDYYYSTVTIVFTSLAPGDSLAVSDMVGSVDLQISYLNTAVTGQVVDKNSQPVADALVTLYDATVFPNVALGQAKTSSAGIYQFTRVDNGLTINIKAQSADGSLAGSLPAPFTLPANVTTDSLRSQVAAERITITPVDDQNPYVIGIVPEHNSDVAPANLQVIYTFSEPIKQTAYTRTDLPPGHSTIADDIVVTFVGLKKGAGVIPFTLQWNSTFTQLTITPQGIIGSARYSTDLRTAFNSLKMTDAAGKTLRDNTAITGDFELLQFTTSGGSAVPAAPSLTRRFVAGLFSELDFNGGNVGLEWNFDSNARSYNIYKSINGGAYELLQKDFYGTQFSNAVTSLVIPAGTTNPLSAGRVGYVVRAVSKDLVESSSSVAVTVTDGVKPKLTNATVASAGATNTWLYTLRFSEPMTIANAQNVGNYTFANTGGVTFTNNAADYLGFSGGQYVVQLKVTTDAALPLGYVLVVNSAVTDLQGNGMDPSANSKTF